MYGILRARLAEQAERAKLGIRIKWFEPIPQDTLEKCQFYKKTKKDMLP